LIPRAETCHACGMTDSSFVKYDGHESPTARWILGRDAQDVRYILHVGTPAFLAKVAFDEETGVLSGLSYALINGGSLYDFLWFDDHPGDAAFRNLMLEAEQALSVRQHS